MYFSNKQDDYFGIIKMQKPSKPRESYSSMSKKRKKDYSQERARKRGEFDEQR